MVAIGAMMPASGCVVQPPAKDRFHPGPLEESALAGLWTMTEESARELPVLGYAKYTNRLQHMILLKEDGQCAYMGFDHFRPRQLWLGGSEDQMYGSFVGETSPLWGHGFVSGRSWLVLRQDAEPVIEGPFLNTNGLGGANMLQNRWPRWRLVKGMMGQVAPGRKDVFRVQTYNPAFLSEEFLVVGEDSDGLFLWKPIEEDPDGTDFETARMVVFRKNRTDSEAVADFSREGGRQHGEK